MVELTDVRRVHEIRLRELKNTCMHGPAAPKSLLNTSLFAVEESSPRYAG